MDEAFNNLKAQGKTNLDGVVQWLKDAKIIDGKTITEEQARTTFNNTTEAIPLDAFKDGVSQLAEKGKSKVDNLVAKLCGTGEVTKQAFEKLKSEGKNNVDSMVQWMKDSKIIDSTKEGEEKARKLFSDVKDPKKVDFEKFSETVSKIKEDTNNFGVITENVKKVTNMMSAFGAATSAFKDAMSK